MQNLKKDVKEKLEAALMYAEMGWPVLPLHTVKDGQCTCGKPGGKCSPGKHPRYDPMLLSKGLHSASTKPNLIRQWWTKWPDANIGVLTGKQSNLIVLDLDMHGDVDGINNAKKEFGWEPQGVYQKTGGGGIQAFYRRPDDVERVKSQCGKGSMAPGVELKADDGYVTVPPSNHISGESYQWVQPPDGSELPQPPEWIMAAQTKKRTERIKAKTVKADADVIPDGERNSTLTSLAGSMRRKGMSEESVLSALLTHNEERCNPPLDTAEVEAIAASVCQYEPGKDQENAEKARRRALEAVKGMIERVKESKNVLEVFEAAPHLARLKRGRYNAILNQLKGILGKSLNLNELKAEVKDAERELSRIEKDARIREGLHEDGIFELADMTVAEAARNVIDWLSITSKPKIFQRGRTLVRVVHGYDGPQLETLKRKSLRSHLANHFEFRMGGEKIPYPDEDIVDDILNQVSWSLPPVRGMTHVPMLRENGSLLKEKGYDADTRYIFLPGKGMEEIEIAEQPNPSDVRLAVRVIEELLHDFPFVDHSAKVNAIGLLLTPVVKTLVNGQIPAFGINATKEGTGKTKLAHLVSIVSTGEQAPAITAPSGEDEWRKTITSFLMRGSPLVLIDNADGALQTDALAAAITSSTYGGRVLGKSEVNIPNGKTLWMTTGNGLYFAGNLARRGVMIDLDSRSSRPWLRTKFRHSNIEKWARDNRQKIVCALLTLARSWVAAESPQAGDVPIFGGFQEWTNVVGSILKNANINGFLGNLERRIVEQNYGDLQWEQFLLTVLYRSRVDNPFRASELFNAISASDGTGDISVALLPDELAEAWEPKNTAGFTRRLGQALRRHQGERFGDAEIRVETAGKKQNTTLWKISLDNPPENEVELKIPGKILDLDVSSLEFNKSYMSL